MPARTRKKINKCCPACSSFFSGPPGRMAARVYCSVGCKAEAEYADAWWRDIVDDMQRYNKLPNCNDPPRDPTGMARHRDGRWFFWFPKARVWKEAKLEGKKVVFHEVDKAEVPPRFA